MLSLSIGSHHIANILDGFELGIIFANRNSNAEFKFFIIIIILELEQWIVFHWIPESTKLFKYNVPANCSPSQKQLKLRTCVCFWFFVMMNFHFSCFFFDFTKNFIKCIAYFVCFDRIIYQQKWFLEMPICNHILCNMHAFYWDRTSNEC